MTIDSSWIACLKEEVPCAFTPRPPFEPNAVFLDGQIRLMCPMSSEALTWDDYIERQFARHILLHLKRPRVSCVILAFDDYAHVPAAKSMTQAKRRRHLPPVTVHARDALPPAIERLEAEQTILTGKLGDPLFFKKPATEVTQATVRLHELEAELARAYARWAELEG